MSDNFFFLILQTKSVNIFYRQKYYQKGHSMSFQTKNMYFDGMLGYGEYIDDKSNFNQKEYREKYNFDTLKYHHFSGIYHDIIVNNKIKDIKNEIKTDDIKSDEVNQELTKMIHIEETKLKDNKNE